MTQKPRYKRIHALWLFLELQKRGFKPVETIKDPEKPQILNWIFEDTEELEKAMTELLGN